MIWQRKPEQVVSSGPLYCNCHPFSLEFLFILGKAAKISDPEGTFNFQQPNRTFSAC